MTNRQVATAPMRVKHANILSSVATNVSVMMVGQVVTFALTFVLRAALGRYLGDVGFGKLTFALSLGAIYAMIAGLGLGPLVAKEAARTRHRAGEFMINGLLLRLIVGVALYALFFAAVSVIKEDPETRYLAYLVGFSLLIGSLVTLLSAVFQAFERMIYVALGTVVEKALVTALAIALLATGHGILTVGWVMVLGSAANLAVSCWFVRRLGRMQWSLGFRRAKTLLLASMPFFVWAVFTTIYARTAATMLSIMTNDAVTGWYGVSFALYETLAFLPAMLKTVLLPIMSRLFVADRSDFRVTFRESFYFFSLITPPMAFGVCALARPIIGLIYPLEQFANAVIVTRILALGLIPLFYNILLATVLVATDRQRYWSVAAVACAFINPAINFFLIPYYQSVQGNGGIGAAWAANFVEVLLLVVAIVLLPPKVLRRSDLTVALRTTFAGAVMGGVVWWQASLALPLSVALGVVTYAALCFVLGVARLDEIKNVFKLLKNRHGAAGLADAEGT